MRVRQLARLVALVTCLSMGTVGVSGQDVKQPRAGSRKAPEATDAAIAVRSALQAQAEYQRALDLQLAPIRSDAGLHDHLGQSRSEGSPLDRLSSSARERFLQSLVFTGRGLGSFYFGDLEAGLSATEIREILSLFGRQTVTPQLRGASMVTEADRLMMSPPTPDLPPHPRDWKDYLCDSPGTCVVAEY